MNSLIRKPTVAGSFYPDDPEELNDILDTLINQSEEISAEGRLRILIIPHAGIQFSGRTAAAGFKQIEDKDYTKIILLGVSHRAFFNHAAVFNKGSWETPLKVTPVTQNFATAIINQDENIIADPAPHLAEHSLEMELIFLQKVLKNFKIVPILISQVSEQLTSNLARRIAQNFDKQTLLVISSDFSHYPPYEVANEVDGKTIKAILTGDEKKFTQTIQALESKGYPGLNIAACGYEAVRVALRVGEILKIHFNKLKYENSGDVSGDKSRVVGYAAIGGWK